MSRSYNNQGHPGLMNDNNTHVGISPQTRVYRRRGDSPFPVAMPTTLGAGSTSRSRLTRAMRNVEEEERDRQAIMDRMREAAFAASLNSSRSSSSNSHHNLSINPQRSSTVHLSGMDPSRRATSNTFMHHESFDDQNLFLAADELLDDAVLNEAMRPSPPPPPLPLHQFPDSTGDDVSIESLYPLDSLQTDLVGSYQHSESVSSRRRIHRNAGLRRPTGNRTSARPNSGLNNTEDVVASLTNDTSDSTILQPDSIQVKDEDEAYTDPFSGSNEVSRPASGGSLGSFSTSEAHFLTPSNGSPSDKRGDCNVEEGGSDVEVVEMKREDLDKKLPAASATDNLDQCSGISCCICLDLTPKKDLSMIDGCKHKFCFECIEKWADRENSCPLCKERFHKIERVYRAERRSKKRKSGEAGRNVNIKRVKNRSQRADYTSGSALQGLLQGMESGTLPQSLAHFIFSNIPGGIMNGYSRGGPSGLPISVTRTGNGSSFVYSSNGAQPSSDRSAGNGDSSRVSSVRVNGSAISFPTSTTFRFRAGGGRGASVQHLDSFSFMGGPTSGGRSGYSFLDDLHVDGDDLGADLGIPSASSSSVMPPWINPFYSAESSRGTRTSNAPVVPPPRSYAANGLQANAGSTAANALEIVDSDEEDIIEMVVTQT